MSLGMFTSYFPVGIYFVGGSEVHTFLMNGNTKYHNYVYTVFAENTPWWSVIFHQIGSHKPPNRSMSLSLCPCPVPLFLSLCTYPSVPVPFSLSLSLYICPSPLSRPSVPIPVSPPCPSVHLSVPAGVVLETVILYMGYFTWLNWLTTSSMGLPWLYFKPRWTNCIVWIGCTPLYYGSTWLNLTILHDSLWFYLSPLDSINYNWGFTFLCLTILPYHGSPGSTNWIWTQQVYRECFIIIL